MSQLQSLKCSPTGLGAFLSSCKVDAERGSRTKMRGIIVKHCDCGRLNYEKTIFLSHLSL